MRLYPFDKPIKPLYFRSFVVSVLFARFHFKIIRKSLYYFRVIAFQFLLLFIRFPAIRIPVYIAPKCGTPLWHETYPIGVGHSTFEVGTAQFRFVSEIARKSSPYCMCVNRSSVRFSLLVGAKALWYIVNITLIWYLPNGDLVKFAFPIRELESNLLCAMFGPT